MFLRDSFCLCVHQLSSCSSVVFYYFPFLETWGFFLTVGCLADVGNTIPWSRHCSGVVLRCGRRMALYLKRCLILAVLFPFTGHRIPVCVVGSIRHSYLLGLVLYVLLFFLCIDSYFLYCNITSVILHLKKDV